MMAKLSSIVVLGQGRFGRLWAGCMAALAPVRAYDPGVSPAAVPYPLLQSQSELQQALLHCDALFFCVPICRLEGLLQEMQPCFAARLQRFGQQQVGPLWVMDTCSVKVQPLRWMERWLSSPALSPVASKPCAKPASSTEGLPFLGLHPMFGPDSVPLLPAGMEKEALQGQTLVLCPPDSATGCGIALWQQRFAQLGLRVLEMSAAEHDREAAQTQGLTHLLGRVLEVLEVGPSPMATAGYRALCQLREQTCHDTWQLFLDLQSQNSYTPLLRKRLQSALAEVYAALKTADSPQTQQ